MKHCLRFIFTVYNGEKITIMASSFDLAIANFRLVFGDFLLSKVIKVVIR